MSETSSTDLSGPIDSGGQPVDVAPIGLNKPLFIRIQQIFTGPNQAEEVLITSAVKSSMTYGKAPYAVNGIRRNVQRDTFLAPVVATDNGTAVVHYSKANLDSTLAMQVRLSFDDFDKKRYERYVDLLAQVVELPIFVSSLGLGPAGAAGGHAAVIAAKNIVKIILGAIDRRIDGDDEKDFIANASLDLDTTGLAQAKAGWFLMRDDDAGELMISPDGAWRNPAVNLTDEASAFTVINGELRYRENERPVDDLDQPFMLLHISGAEKPELDEFAPAAATAAMLEKFLRVQGDTMTDLTEMVKAASDISMTKRIGNLDKRLKGADAATRKKLLEERAAMVKQIQDEDVQELIPAAPE